MNATRMSNLSQSNKDSDFRFRFSEMPFSSHGIVGTLINRTYKDICFAYEIFICRVIMYIYCTIDFIYVC